MKVQYPLIVVLFCVVLSYSSLAQSNEVLKRKVTLPATTIRTDSLMQQLSKQTGTRFSFNPGKITASRKISFSSRQQTIEGVLAQIRKTTGVGYKLIGNHIILVEQPMNTVQKRTGVVTSSKKFTNGGKNRSVSKLTEAKTSEAKRIDQKLTDTTEKSSAIQLDNARIKTDVQPLQAQDTIRKVQNFAVHEMDSVRLVVTSDSNTSKDNMVDTPGVQISTGTKKGVSFFRHFAIEAGLHGVGLNYRLNTGRRSEIEFSAGLGGGYFITGQEFYYSFTFLKPVFYAKVQPKYFLKGEKEKEGSYLGLNLKYTTAQLFSKSSYDSARWISFKGYSVPALLTDIHWGFERAMGSRWQLDGHLGIGYAFDLRYRWGSNHWYPAAGLRVSYRLKR